MPPIDITTVLIDQTVCILLQKITWLTHLLICHELTQYTAGNKIARSLEFKSWHR
jgi:hypothetical protein